LPITWAAPLVGFAAGALGGTATMSGPPMIAYLAGRGTGFGTFVIHSAGLAE
jgi:hypothetical protein